MGEEAAYRSHPTTSTSTFTCLLVHECTGVERGELVVIWFGDESQFPLQRWDGQQHVKLWIDRENSSSRAMPGCIRLT